MRPQIYTQTLKYFKLAIVSFLPNLEELRNTISDKNQKEEISDLIEVYNEILQRINLLNLNCTDPNKGYEGEPMEVDNWISEPMLENLAGLSLRLLASWKDEREKIELRKYPTDKSTQRYHELENLIWPLEALSKAQSYVLGKYAVNGPLVFPGEKNIKETENSKEFDVFISHASEDKDSFVIPLVETLQKEGVKVWYDNSELTWGDSLRGSIDNGLKNSKYGVVILSKSFLGKKKWTEHELDGLFAMEEIGKKVILPIWHDISREDVLAYSPSLADRLAKRSSKDTIFDIVQEIKTLVLK